MKGTRRLRSAGGLLAALLACSCPKASLAAPVNPTATEPGPFSDVPVTHWCYAAIQQLAENGIFTGYPDGMFAGKRALTRYEFAVAVQRMVLEVQRGRSMGLVLAAPFQAPLLKLTQEFSPELAMLGADVTVLRQNLVRFTRPWLVDAPDLATCSPRVYPGMGTPNDPEYQRGCRLAIQEWERGEVVFYVAPASRSPRISASTGVLYRTVDTRTDEPGKLALIAGHNAEVKRRLERFGLPASVHPEWVSRVQNPEQPWREAAPQARLDLHRSEAASRDGSVLLRLEARGRGEGPLLRIATPEHARELPLPGFDLEKDTLEACWSPDRELLHLALRRAGRDAVEVRVVALRSGETLHQVEVSAAALQSAARSRTKNVEPLSEPTW